MKRLLLCAGSALPFLSASAFAQESSGVTAEAPTVTSLVDVSGLGTSLLTSIQAWLMVGLGIGISLFVIYVGWRWLRRFVR